MKNNEWQKQVAEIKRQFAEHKIRQEAAKAEAKAEKENEELEAENKRKKENKKTL